MLFLRPLLGGLHRKTWLEQLLLDHERAVKHVKVGARTKLGRIAVVIAIISERGAIEEQDVADLQIGGRRENKIAVRGLFQSINQD